MMIDDKIMDEKIQYGINREAEKISAKYHQAKLINMNISQAKRFAI